jgi:hypothetical protein
MFQGHCVKGLRGALVKVCIKNWAGHGIGEVCIHEASVSMHFLLKEMEHSKRIRSRKVMIGPGFRRIILVASPHK